MLLEQSAQSHLLHRVLADTFPLSKIVPLKDIVQSISKVSNVRVRTQTVKDYYELGISSVDENGVIQLHNATKNPGAANHSAIEAQRLRKGDLIFGYRGKMGIVGLMSDEFAIPVVTNNGMIRITFNVDDTVEISRYIQTYLQSELVKTYLNSMLTSRGSGVRILHINVLENLPVPLPEDIATFNAASAVRKKIVLKAEKLMEMCMGKGKDLMTLLGLSEADLLSTSEADTQILGALDRLATEVFFL